MRDPITVEKLKRIYDFDYLDLIRLAGEVDAFRHKDICALEGRIVDLKLSWSWRITEPLRVINRLLSRLHG